MGVIIGIGLGIFLTIGIQGFWRHRVEIESWARSRRESYLESKEARKRLRMDSGNSQAGTGTSGEHAGTPGPDNSSKG